MLVDPWGFYQILDGMTFKKSNFALKPIHRDEIESIRAWRNSQIQVLRQSREISEAEQISYFENQVVSEFISNNPSKILLSYHNMDEMIGYGGLVNIDWDNLSGEVSFLLNPIYLVDQRRYEMLFDGFLDLMKELAFTALGLKRIFTETFVFRLAHIETLETSGFCAIKTLSNRKEIDGHYVDSIVHELLLESRKGVSS